jgi:hypothetical protein
MTPLATEWRAARDSNPTAKSVAWCSASIWSAPDRSGLLTLDGSSIQTDPDGSSRIVWMIRRMIRRQMQPRTRRQVHGEPGLARAAVTVG